MDRGNLFPVRHLAIFLIHVYFLKNVFFRQVLYSAVIEMDKKLLFSFVSQELATKIEPIKMFFLTVSISGNANWSFIDYRSVGTRTRRKIRLLEGNSKCRYLKN
jgi:hypothetical protein